jgi:hypothetical protein
VRGGRHRRRGDDDGQESELTRALPVRYQRFRLGSRVAWAQAGPCWFGVRGSQARPCEPARACVGYRGLLAHGVIHRPEQTILSGRPGASD